MVRNKDTSHVHCVVQTNKYIIDMSHIRLSIDYPVGNLFVRTEMVCISIMDNVIVD